ncbi:MAG: hypothetical protein JSS83_20860 [Cyanobacteria bacterium SZAS LIN-3]|nr:hypothetical protein [Cyanobacteria bacterium SZAS LIN-3]MBS2010599.1 hypothetical protein [Cyanobacteria bacterium SZAS TMP-1]
MSNESTQTQGPCDDQDELWDTRRLGASEEHAMCVPVSAEVERQIDAALGLEPTELRLTIELVASFKALAAEEGIGYRPLMRRALAEYVQARGLPSAPTESRIQTSRTE